MINDTGFVIEGTEEPALPVHRHDLVTTHRGAGSELPANT
jgi:biotin synthase